MNDRTRQLAAVRRSLAAALEDARNGGDRAKVISQLVGMKRAFELMDEDALADETRNTIEAIQGL